MLYSTFEKKKLIAKNCINLINQIKSLTLIFVPMVHIL